MGGYVGLTALELATQAGLFVHRVDEGGVTRQAQWLYVGPDALERDIAEIVCRAYLRIHGYDASGRAVRHMMQHLGFVPRRAAPLRSTRERADSGRVLAAASP